MMKQFSQLRKILKRNRQLGVKVLCVMCVCLFLTLRTKVEINSTDAMSSLCIIVQTPYRLLAPDPDHFTVHGKTWAERGFDRVPFLSPPLIENGELCDNKNYSILIYVHSAANNFIVREQIRETWGSNKYSFGNRIKHVFLLGNNGDKATNKLVSVENEKYSDIVQFNISDMYDDHTYRGLETYRWITKHCQSVQYFIKTDDDVVINIWAVMSELKTTKPFGITKSKQSIITNNNKDIKNKENDINKDNTNDNNKEEKIFISCGVIEYRRPMTRCGKNAVPVYEYQGTVKPPYCPGAGYVLNYETIARLYKASYKAPFSRLDDVFFTGFLPIIDGNIQLQTLPRHSYLRNALSYRIQQFFSSTRVLRDYMFIHFPKKDQFMPTWHELLDIYEHKPKLT